MGKRGPRPRSRKEHLVEVSLFRSYADNWGLFFYLLRDGAPGYIGKTFGEQSQPTITVPLKQLLESGEVTVEIPMNPDQTIRGAVKPSRTSTEIIEPNVPSARLSAPQASALNPKAGWSGMEPTNPRPDLWKKLKNAPNFAEHKQTATETAEWWRTTLAFFVLGLSPSFHENVTDNLHLLASHDLFSAKRLRLYPHSGRPTSDNKRVEFFAKAMAGLSRGIAPATAIEKKPKGVHFPTSEERGKPFRNHVARKRFHLRATSNGPEINS